MLAQQAISVLSGIIHDKSLVGNAQILHGSFTRKRKISLDDLLGYLIFRNHNVLSEDLVSYFGALGNFDIPTRQAMIKRISILNYDVWDSIMDRFRNEIYNELPLLNIKDYNFCPAWVAKQSDRFISEFIRLSQHIPQRTFIDTIQEIGYERVADICNVYRHIISDSSFNQNFFNKSGINLIAIIDILSEDRSSESKWVGGYWTWGEGMKKQDLETKTYLSLNYSFDLYVKSEYAQSICIDNIDNNIVESVNKCLENKYKGKTDTSTYNVYQSNQNQLPLDSCTSLSLSKSQNGYYWIMCLTDTAGRKRLVKLSILDRIKEPQSFSRIASFEEQYTKFLIGTTIVECDD